MELHTGGSDLPTAERIRGDHANRSDTEHPESIHIHQMLIRAPPQTKDFLNFLFFLFKLKNKDKTPGWP